METISLSFASAGCNRISQCTAWSREASIIAYPADRNIFLARVLAEAEDESMPTPHIYGRVVASLVGHTARVTCLKWVAASSSPLDHDLFFANESILVSGSSDKSIRVWSLPPSSSPSPPSPASAAPWQWPMQLSPWVLSATLEGHTGAVTQLDTLSVPSFPADWTPSSVASSPLAHALFIASTSTDGTVRIWLSVAREGSPPAAWSCIQTIHFATKYIESVSLALLPASRLPILAAGGVDKKVHIFVWDTAPSAKQFVRVSSLQGHEDWVRSVSFAHVPLLLPPLPTPAPSGTLPDAAPTSATIPCLLLASAAQDSLVRIWRLETDVSSFDASGNRLPRVTDASLEALLTGHDDHVYSVSWQPPEAKLDANDSDAQAAMYGRAAQPLAILTASMDRTMMIWRPEAESGIWMNEVRVGEFGGSGLGFYGSVLGPHGRFILAHSFQGALHLWMKGTSESELWTAQPVVSGHFGAVEDLDWDPTGELLLTASSDQTSRVFANWRRSSAGGTSATVSSWHEIARPQIHGYDMQCISSAGSFRLVSGADEKVVRVFDATRHFRETIESIIGCEDAGSAKCLAEHPKESGLAQALQTQAERRRLLLSDQTWKIAGDGSSIDPLLARGRALGATVPALGLTNKAVFEDDLGSGGKAVAAPDTLGDDAFKKPKGKGKGATAGPSAGGGEDEEGGAGGAGLDEREAPPGYSFRHEKIVGPPLEEHLMQNTLWPESQKLYGHGNELFCCAVTHNMSRSSSGAWTAPYIDSKFRLVASACKASRPENATIRIWELDTWKEVAVLGAHTLTVTQLAFSHSDEYLLSVSRDRHWVLFKREGALDFQLVAKVNAHERIIWSCGWSHDDKFFATASRDKLIKVWGHDGASGWKNVLTISSFDESITAVDWAPVSYPAGSNGYLLVAGLENGLIGAVQLLRSDNDETLKVHKVAMLDKSICHAGTVRRIRFRPFAVANESNSAVALQFATCGADFSVRLYDALL